MSGLLARVVAVTVLVALVAWPERHLTAIVPAMFITTTSKGPGGGMERIVFSERMVLVLGVGTPFAGPRTRAYRLNAALPDRIRPEPFGCAFPIFDEDGDTPVPRAPWYYRDAGLHAVLNGVGLDDVRDWLPW